MLHAPVYPQRLSVLTEQMVAVLAASLAAWPQSATPPPFDLGAAITDLMLGLTVHAFVGAARPDAEERSILFRTHFRAAHALVWAFHFLTHQPPFQQRMHREVDGVVGKHSPTFANLAHLTATAMLLHEAFRYTSPCRQLSGAIDNVLPPAAQITAARQQVIHQRPSHWHDTECHLAAHAPAIHHHLALLAGQLVLAMVLQQYELAPLPQDSYRHSPFFGPWVTLRQRT
jgi:hypothetical protein